MTAPAKSAASPFRFWAAEVFVLRAALARLGDLVDPGLDIPHLEPVKSVRPDAGGDVEPDEGLIGRVGQRSQIRCNHLIEPVREELTELRHASGHRALSGLLLKLEPLVMHYLTGCAVDVLALSLPVGFGDPHIGSESVAVGKIEPSPFARARLIMLLLG